MEFDLVSYVLGIIATVIGSSVVVLFSLWANNKSNQKRSIKALFSEIEHNYHIVKGLLGEENYLPKHWAYDRMKFQRASFDNSKQNSWLYSLKPSTYEKISKAYDIISLIEKEGYGPKGTANTPFYSLKDMLKEIIEKDMGNTPVLP